VKQSSLNQFLLNPKTILPLVRARSSRRKERAVAILCCNSSWSGFLWLERTADSRSRLYTQIMITSLKPNRVGFVALKRA